MKDKCSKCGITIGYEPPERCWICHAPMCGNCWEHYGQCCRHNIVKENQTKEGLKLKAQVLRNEAECLKNRIKLMELESKVHEIINNMEGVNHDGVEFN